MRASISQPFALDALQGGISAGLVIEAQPFAMVVHKVALGSVAVQMRLAYMKMAAINRAFENAEVIFNRVGVPEIGTDVFLSTMINPTMASETSADTGIHGASVSRGAKLLDLKGRLRCRGCGRKGRAVVSIK